MIEQTDRISYADACAITGRSRTWLRVRAQQGILSREKRWLCRPEVEQLAVREWTPARHQPGGYWCTTEEVREILQVNKQRVTQLAQAGKLTPFRTSRGRGVAPYRVLFRRHEVEEFARTRHMFE